MAFVEIKNLTFSYPAESGETVKAIDNVNISLEKGEFLLICGDSGCGKSTLLRQLKPSLRPFGKMEGEVLIDGIANEKLDFKTQSGDIGFVMQDPEMQIVTDKVWHELAFGLENLGVNNRTMRMRVAEIANFFGINTLLDRPTAELSGGQKQLICLAAVMAMQPKLLLLDEPTSQLDPIAANDFFMTLKRINEELGTTIIITEHRYETLFTVADKVAFMQKGRIIAQTAPENAISALSGRDDFINVLPTPMRLFSAVVGKADAGPAPITVKDARRLLESTVTHAEIKKREEDKSVERNKDAETLVSLKEVWLRYERNSQDVLRGLNLCIKSGELFCIIGGNGAGKTTALMTAAGLYKPYRGSVKFKGKNIDKFSKTELYGKQIGVLVQNPQCCLAADTVREELDASARNFGIGAERIEEVIETMDIRSILDSNPYDISGGELQRAAIAKLLLPKPQLLLMDEATKGMHPLFKEKFGTMLKQLTRQGTSIVLVSHDIEFCAEFADRCAMFFDGAVTAEGTPRQVLLDNSFYTTAANRISRGIISSALTTEELIGKVRDNRRMGERHNG